MMQTSRTLILLVALLLPATLFARQGPLWLTPTDLGVGPKRLSALSVLRHKAKLRRFKAGDPRRAAPLYELAQHHQARGSAAEARRLYRELLKEPGDEKKIYLDAIHFNLALLSMKKEPKVARSLLTELIKRRPRSRYIPFVFLLFGKHYLRKGEHKNAARFFERVAMYDKSPAARYAHYLQGHSAQQLGRHRDALQLYFQCLRPSTGSFAALPKTTQKRLLVAARAGLVEAFAQAGRVDRARPFFVRAVGRQAAEQMLEHLATVYDRLNLPAQASRARKDAQALRASPPPGP
jgi:tetratricopeptide (TPR) repeat protein